MMQRSEKNYSRSAPIVAPSTRTSCRRQWDGQALPEGVRIGRRRQLEDKRAAVWVESQLSESDSERLNGASQYEIHIESGRNDPLLAMVNLEAIHESEAKRIAYRLHDESSQMLATLYIELNNIARDCSAIDKEKMATVMRHLDEVCEQLRHLAYELCPPLLDRMGFMPALEFLLSGFRKRSKLQISLVGSLDRVNRSSIEITLYRVIQESLANVVKHARAGEVQICISQDDYRVNCKISDNGCGFAEPTDTIDKIGGLGLCSVRDRIISKHGKFRIISHPGIGTSLEVSIPL